MWLEIPRAVVGTQDLHVVVHTRPRKSLDARIDFRGGEASHV